MNAQEQQVLETFLNQLVQARALTKDPQASSMIREAVQQQPDAAYLLVQKVLLLDRALAQTKAQIAELQAAHSSASAGFLNSSNAWGNNPTPASAPMPTPAMPAANSAPSSARPGFFSDGVRSTLGSIASTAAGVAGGALLFEGVEHMLHHNSGNGFFSAPAAGGLPQETTIVNNYYDSAPATSDLRGDDGFFDAGSDWDDGTGDTLI